jgi:hypothetical protein
VKPTILVLAGLIVPASLTAQSDYPHHNLTFGAGAAQPGGDLSGLFLARPGISLGYGYRFQRYFQIDAGFETVFGAADVHDYLTTGIGPLRIRDFQFFFPFGGRAILPLAGGRLLLSGGGGGAYLRYSELLHQPSEDFHVDCPVCSTRDGWGYYALAAVSAFVDRRQHFSIGVTSRIYRGHTQGDALAAIPAIRTRDRWINTYAQFGFSF